MACADGCGVVAFVEAVFRAAKQIARRWPFELSTRGICSCSLELNHIGLGQRGAVKSPDSIVGIRFGWWEHCELIGCVRHQSRVVRGLPVGNFPVGRIVGRLEKYAVFTRIKTGDGIEARPQAKRLPDGRCGKEKAIEADDQARRAEHSARAVLSKLLPDRQPIAVERCCRLDRNNIGGRCIERLEACVSGITGACAKRAKGRRKRIRRWA